MKFYELFVGAVYNFCGHSIQNRRNKENLQLLLIQREVCNSMNDINKTLKDIKNWDELVNIKEESHEENELIQNKTYNPDLKTKKCFFDLLGLIFCFFHLIGIQAGIIILNSLFSEIADEFKLLAKKTPRKNNFYEKLEINTYRDLPEIDVAMVTSSIGIVVLKEIGFIKANSIFQIFYSFFLIILFLLFKFHISENLLINYTYIEIFVLIVSYIILSFLVGCSSTLALKEYFVLFSKVYNKKENEPEGICGEKTIFYSLSGLSSFGVIFINRFIFIFFKNRESRWLLVSLTCVCFASFFVSLFFYLLYSIPIINKFEKKENNQIQMNIKKEAQDQKINEDKKEEDIKNNSNINKEELDNKDNIINLNRLETIKSEKDSEMIVLKDNQDFTKNIDMKVIERIEKYIEEQKIYSKKYVNSTKICTLCGYVYIKKETQKYNACIFYNYTNKCSWLKQKILKMDVIIPILIEFISQFYTVGYNSILYDKLLKVYSLKKNFIFFGILFTISIFFSSFFAVQIRNGLKRIEKEYKAKPTQDNAKTLQKNCFLFSYYIFFLFMGFTFFTFISSIFYLLEENKTRERWDNIIMSEFIYFKSIDLSILSFFDFFDNTDLFNTTLFITLEKVTWMIIEAILDAVEIKEKTLIIIQIAFSSIPSFIYSIYLVLMGGSMCRKKLCSYH